MSQESEFECPNCGEMVYQELFACPKCGLVFHPLDEDDDDVSPPDAAVEEGFSPGAVFAGWVVSAGLAFLLNVLVSSLWPVSSTPPFGRAVLFISGPLGALAGGALAARLAPGRPAWHGLGVAAASLVSAYLLEAVRRDLSADPLTTAILASWALILTAGPLGAVLPTRLSGMRLPSSRAGRERRLYNTLLMRVRHDPATADRLIDLERSRFPNRTRAQWIENAIERIDRDRR
jgi:hypothetical protein